MTQTNLDRLVLALALFTIIFLTILSVLIALFFPQQALSENFRTARRLAAPIVHLDKVVSRDSVPVVTILCTVTAYSPTVAQTDSSPLVTASGQRVRVGGIAADLRVFPFGTILIIPGYNGGNPCTVIDTGSMIKGKTLDVLFWHEQDAVNWGRRHNVPVQVLYIPKEAKHD